MIQSGNTTNSGVSFDFTSKGSSVNVTIPVVFPKPFNNPPVVQASAMDIISEKDYSINGMPIKLVLKSYDFNTDNITKEGFNIEVSITYKLLPNGATAGKDNLMNFNWLAYDEVTIGA